MCVQLTAANSEFENILQASTKIKSFISQQVLTTIFDATKILVFLPVLFGYSPLLALVVVLFATTIGAISLFGKWRQRLKGLNIQKSTSSITSEFRINNIRLPSTKVFKDLGTFIAENLK